MKKPVKPNTFQCAACHQTFEKEWSDDEAKAEFAAEFPGESISSDNTAIVCNECYRAMMAAFRPEEP